MELLLVVGGIASLVSWFSRKAAKKEASAAVEDFRQMGTQRENRARARLVDRAGGAQGPLIGWWGPGVPTYEVFPGAALGGAHTPLRLPQTHVPLALRDTRAAAAQHPRSGPGITEPAMAHNEVLALRDKRRFQ